MTDEERRPVWPVKIAHEQKATLLAERDGDFNPGWLVFLVAFVAILVVVFIFLFMVLMGPAGAAVLTAGVSALWIMLAFLFGVMLLAAVGVYALERLKYVPMVGEAVGEMLDEASPGGRRRGSMYGGGADYQGEID